MQISFALLYVRIFFICYIKTYFQIIFYSNTYFHIIFYISTYFYMIFYINKYFYIIFYINTYYYITCYINTCCYIIFYISTYFYIDMRRTGVSSNRCTVLWRRLSADVLRCYEPDRVRAITLWSSVTSRCSGYRYVDSWSATVLYAGAKQFLIFDILILQEGSFGMVSLMKELSVGFIVHINVTFVHLY